MVSIATPVLSTVSLLSIEDLLKISKEYNPGADLDMIRRAYVFTEEAHRGQMRETGEPYVQHPLHVAYTIAGLRLGTTAIIAALLHDVREDTSSKYSAQIGLRFGSKVGFLVEGVTKLSKVRKLRENRGSVDDLRNIFIAMTRDIRVIIIKLADRLHNLQTLSGLDSARRLRIAQQTLDIYAPIADRLGMGDIKGQLEDLAFVHALPDKANWIRSLVKDAYAERVTRCAQLQQEVSQELTDNKIQVLDVHGRAKRLYSLYLKLPRYNNDINQIFDLVALRVVVPTLDDCYQALGVIHRRWRPLVGKIKDYCATPKANGYQSLHTTVIVDEGRFLEIQIRTADMHERAERGVAASWAYADSKRTGGPALAAALADDHDIAWVQQLARWQQDVDTPEEFFQTLRSDFFKNRIFCLTPRGEVINLPEGASPVDFAYAIHSSMGNRVLSAKINGLEQPLDYVLANGDMVEIVLGPKSQAPHREWLDFVKTNSAKKAIKHWYTQLSRRHSRQVGRELIEKELQQLLGRKLESIQEQEVRDYLVHHGYRTMDQLFMAIGQGERNPRQVVKRIFAEDRLDHTVPVQRQLNVRTPGFEATFFARSGCCRPIEGDHILGIKNGTRVEIHRSECSHMQNINPTQVLAANWVIEAGRTYRVWIKASVKTQIGMLRDVADVCARQRIAIHDVTVRRLPTGMSTISVFVEIKDADQLSTLLRKLQALPAVMQVRRRHS